MIWYQTLVGPLYRFQEEAPAPPLTQQERLRNGNRVRLERARAKFMAAMTDKPQSAAEISKKIGLSKSNVLDRAHYLHAQGVIEKITYNMSTGGKKYLWRLKCQ